MIHADISNLNKYRLLLLKEKKNYVIIKGYVIICNCAIFMLLFELFHFLISYLSCHAENYMVANN